MTFLSRIAGAPITWGVDGSPGWGHLMDRERVLAEMQQVGLSATELGPDGYLPGDADELRALLDRFGQTLIGGFVPAVLYRPDLASENLAYVRRAASTLARTCLCHGVPAIGSRSSPEVSSFGAVPCTIRSPSSVG